MVMSSLAGTTRVQCKAKMQYLLTLQVSRYCFLALQSRRVMELPEGSRGAASLRPKGHGGSVWGPWNN